MTNSNARERRRARKPRKLWRRPWRTKRTTFAPTMPNPATIVNWATGPCGTTKTNTSPPATSRHDIEGENDDGTFHGAFARRLQGGATRSARRNPRGRWQIGQTSGGGRGGQ